MHSGDTLRKMVRAHKLLGTQLNFIGMLRCSNCSKSIPNFKLVSHVSDGSASANKKGEDECGCAANSIRGKIGETFRVIFLERRPVSWAQKLCLYDIDLEVAELVAHGPSSTCARQLRSLQHHCPSVAPPAVVGTPPLLAAENRQEFENPLGSNLYSDRPRPVQQGNSIPKERTPRPTG